MKKTILFTAILLAFGLLGNLSANKFPKCEDACQKYYTCVVSANPNASEENKDMLRKGCNLNCNKTKYYKSIESCYDKSQGSCKVYWNCITKALQK
jgi:Cys-rich protein (TIGR04453 family)